MELTHFLDFKSNKPDSQKPLSEIVDLIKTDSKLEKLTRNYRRFLGVQSKKRSNEDKMRFPQVAIHATMKDGKRREDCIEPTGLLFLDLDQHGKDVMPEEQTKEIFKKMANDPHTVVGCTSMSGLGYHVIVRYEMPDALSSMQPGSLDSKELNRCNVLFHRIYKHVADYYTQLTGMEMDMQCANFVQLMALSHDPDVVYNEEAMPFALNFEMLGLNEKGDFINKGGRPKSAKNKPSTKRVSVSGDEEMDMAFYLAAMTIERQGAQWVAGHHNDYLTRLAHQLNRYGCDQQKAEEEMDKRYGDEYKDMLPSRVLCSVYQCHSDEHGTVALPKNSSGVTSRIKYYITHFGIVMRRLALSNRLETKMAPSEGAEGEAAGEACYVEFTDSDFNTLYCRLEEQIPGLRRQQLSAVLNSDFLPLYNPMKDYFTDLEPWDGHDYLGDLANRVHMEDEEEHCYFDLCLRRWMVAMVGTWVSYGEPRHKRTTNQLCLILCGRQGIYKSTFLSRLLPPEFEQFVSLQDVTRPGDKDETLRSSQYALVMFDEIDGFTPRELNKLKSLLTSEATDERESYGTYKQHRQRLASYCGSSNYQKILSDITGNRRWLPFWVDSIVSPFDNPLPYRQLYAQLLHLYRTGYRYWLEEDDIKELEAHNEMFRQLSIEEELLMVYYARPSDPLVNGIPRVLKQLTTAEIIAHISIFSTLRKPFSPRKMAIILKKLGFESGHSRTGRFWYVAERSLEEIEVLSREKG